MRVANPILDVINKGGASASNTLSAAARTGLMADQSFARGASMALKMDQLLQQEESKLYNRMTNAQNTLQKGIQNVLGQQWKERNFQYQKERAQKRDEQWQATYDFGVERHEDMLRQQTFTDKLGVSRYNLNVNKALLDMGSKLATTIRSRGTQASKMFDQFIKASKEFKEYGMNNQKVDTNMSNALKRKALEYIGAMQKTGTATAAEAAALARMLSGPDYQKLQLPNGDYVDLAVIPESVFDNTAAAGGSGATLAAPGTAPDSTVSQAPNVADLDKPVPEQGFRMTNAPVGEEVPSTLGGVDGAITQMVSNATGIEMPQPTSFMQGAGYQDLPAYLSPQATALNNSTPYTLDANTNFQGLAPEVVQTELDKNYGFLMHQIGINDKGAYTKLSGIPKERLLSAEGAVNVIKNRKTLYDANSGLYNPDVLKDFVRPEYLLDTYAAVYGPNDQKVIAARALDALTENKSVIEANDIAGAGSEKLFDTIGWNKGNVDAYVDAINKQYKNGEIYHISQVEHDALRRQAEARSGNFQPDAKKIESAVSSVVQPAAGGDTAIGDVWRTSAVFKPIVDAVIPGMKDFAEAGTADSEQITKEISYDIRTDYDSKGWSGWESFINIVDKNKGRYLYNGVFVPTQYDKKPLDLARRLEDQFGVDYLVKNVPGYTFANDKRIPASSATDPKYDRMRTAALAKYAVSEEFKTSKFNRALSLAEKHYSLGDIRNGKVAINLGKEKMVFDKKTVEDFIVLKYGNQLNNRYADK